jgi:serine protease inhibitor
MRLSLPVMAFILALPVSAFASAFSLAKPGENFVYSPFGVERVSALILPGAKGKTAAEFKSVFPDLAKDANSVASASGDGFRFEMANSAWIKKNYPILPEYQASLRKSGSSIDSLAFTDPARDAETIDAWVKKNTKGKIPHLINPSAISSETRLILVNALYFKGRWQDPFKPEGTRAAEFHPAEGKTYLADFMNQTERFGTIRRRNYDIVVLPYRGGHQSLWLALPHPGMELTKIESEFDEGALEKSYGADKDATHAKMVRLRLPKFSISSELGLVSYLETRGLKRAFSAKDADFSGISQEKPLFVSAVLQRAVIDLDEEGTEAAAATAMMMEGSGMPVEEEKPIELTFDHPFDYFLRDTATGKILFMGRLARAPESPIRK